MSQEALTPEQALAFMRDLTELSRKHGIWLFHHWETIIASKSQAAGYDWENCTKFPQIYLEGEDKPENVTPLEVEG